MPQLSLFETHDLPPAAARLGPRLRALAEQGVYFGTSSWKYPGWVGQIYSEERYLVRGAFSARRFASECLAEYARTFPLVGGDFTFYQFPDRQAWRRLFDGVPESLLFAFKVPEDITVATWPGHARYGSRAGRANPGFLDAPLFAGRFAAELAPYRDRVAALILEFGTFPKSTFSTPGAFLERLAPFLGSLPEGFRYSFEIRNPEYLVSDYFALLAAHNVAHLFNAWTRMPEPADQIALPGAFTADFTVARMLLRRGRPYEEAVAMFEPYRLVQEPNSSGRAALAALAERGRDRRKPTFLLVNNRYEGNAPATIEAVAGTFAG
jgi:uncharacterized protein YecE (DUF72 family)